MESFIRLAIRAAKRGIHEEYPVGAVIVDKNRVVSTGFNNQHKTHPMIKAIDPHRTLHAEIHAIIRSGRCELQDATVIVYRQSKTGKMAMAKPCPTCQALLKEHGVSRMIYSTPEGWAREKIA